VSAAITTKTYTIDRAHSEVTFQVRHLLTRLRGTFWEFSGAIEYDEENPERSSMNVTVQAGSIDTKERDRDRYLRSADFFDVKTFRTLTFRSTAFRRRTDTEFEVAGELTIHGVPKSVTFDVVSLGKAKDPRGNERIAFEAETVINRKDFRLTWNTLLDTVGFLVGNDVKISLSAQAILARG
jgi:polyisoprenoid-binding protein YceI